MPDVFVNAFTKLHKTDRKWIEIRERADKLDEDTVTLKNSSPELYKRRSK